MKSIAERGILLLATGNSLYGKLAFNAALSIKAGDPTIKIALVCDKSAISELKENHISFFNHMYEIPKQCIELNGKPHHFKAKTHLYDLTPFEKTLFIDADTLFNQNKKVSWLFGELDSFDFCVPNNGCYDPKTGRSDSHNYLWWDAKKDVNCIRDYYKLVNLMPQTNTTLIYFKKSETTEKIFKKATEIYCDEKAPKQLKKWGYADEFCFNVSMSLNNILPHKLQWHPIYIHFINKNLREQKIFNDYWGLTNGGHLTNTSLIKIYNRLVNAYCLQMSVPERFYHVNKSEVIPERRP